MSLGVQPAERGGLSEGLYSVANPPWVLGGEEGVLQKAGPKLSCFHL